MWTAFLIGLVLVVAVAGLMLNLPTFAKIVGAISGAAIFLMVVMFALTMIGDKFLAMVR